MSYLTRVFIFILALAVVGYIAHSKKDNLKPVSNEFSLLKETDHLSHQGVLQQNKDGYIYLKVDDAYVNDLFPSLKQPGLRKPSTFYSRTTPIKAHISVMYKDDGSRLGPIEELGKTFDFTPTKIVQLNSKGKEYVVVEVDAPQLEALRKKYGLQEKLLGHEFHITIAQKKIGRKHEKNQAS